MTLNLIPKRLRRLYETYEWRNACAVLSSDYPDEWRDILAVLSDFKLKRSDIAVPGGSKSRVAGELDTRFYQLGWKEKAFDTKIVVDDAVYETPTHAVDCYKNKVAVEVEWNNKDPFFDRDLNNFRLLFELRAISAGVIITRCDELQQIFVDIGRGRSYGNSTTHMSKLLPRLEGGSGGGCPVLVFGISKSLYVED